MLPLCLADHLAVRIDEPTWADGAAAGSGKGAALAKPSGNALIWVEGEPRLAGGHGAA